MTNSRNKVVLLAGGVGGAKIAEGLSQIIPDDQLIIYVNTGDDFQHFGLEISPDLDTVTYMMAGLSNPDTGWGRAEETWNALKTIELLDGPMWFNLGDKDLGNHLERTRLKNKGFKLSEVSQLFCEKYGIRQKILPMSDDQIQTMIHTVEFGFLSFQEYFVKQRCEPVIDGIKFRGIGKAQPVNGMVETIKSSKFVIIAPSNPWVSIDPIIAMKGVRSALKNKTIVAISPIIGGKPVKGPVCKMYRELGYEASALSVVKHYQGFLRGFILDHADSNFESEIIINGIIPYVTNTIMHDKNSRRKLAQETLDFCGRLNQ
jgi:LPPG:FO 2-phospho-L-lactate transferase